MKTSRTLQALRSGIAVALLAHLGAAGCSDDRPKPEEKAEVDHCDTPAGVCDPACNYFCEPDGPECSPDDQRRAMTLQSSDADADANGGSGGQGGSGACGLHCGVCEADFDCCQEDMRTGARLKCASGICMFDIER